MSRISRQFERFVAEGHVADERVVQAAPDVHADVDAAYHAKYDRYGPQIVNTVVGPGAAAVTIRLIPTPTTTTATPVTDQR